MKERIQRKLHSLQERLVRKWWSVKRNWRNFLAKKPTWWAILTAYWPVRVWHIYSPEYYGPYYESIAEAAEYVEADSEMYEDENGIITPVVFTDAERRWLRCPGWRVKKGMWAIKCRLMPKYMVGLYEWEGL